MSMRLNSARPLLLPYSWPVVSSPLHVHVNPDINILDAIPWHCLGVPIPSFTIAKEAYIWQDLPILSCGVR
jgi:hypothetical protein